MYPITGPQLASEHFLKTTDKRWRFSNWIDSGEDDPVTGERLGTMVFEMKPTKFITSYRQIDPDGIIS